MVLATILNAGQSAMPQHPIRIVPSTDLQPAHQPRMTPLIPAGVVLLLILLGLSSCNAAQPSQLQVVAPQPWQVLQREMPPQSPGAEKEQQQAQSGTAVRLQLTGQQLSAPIEAAYWRVLPCNPATEPTVTQVATTETMWQPLQLMVTEHGEQPDNAAGTRATAQAEIRMPAGGWYRLEVRLQSVAGHSTDAAVEPVGVGEVFLIAGQSYATNTNDQRLQVRDPQRRVAALNTETGVWQLADDPQPAPDHSDGGSIWPAVGDRLASALNVPVGFVNVAVGGTAVRQWLPTEPLSQRLHAAGRSTGRFRAVLWQQGESDVIENTSIADYVSRLQSIRSAAVAAWQFSPAWYCALSTHHPTVYNNPDGENRIRDAIRQVSQLPGFALGPDTDQLRGPNRGGPKSRRHFSAIGQQNAAELWASLLLRREFNRP